MPSMATLVGLAAALCLLPRPAAARTIDIETAGAVPDKTDFDTLDLNARVLNTTLQSLRPGDTLVVSNKTFHTMGGIVADGLNSVTIQLDGTIRFSGDPGQAEEEYIRRWPRINKHVRACMEFNNLVNVSFTSSGIGTLDGAGEKWWGIPGVGYLLRTENRPRLIAIQGSKSILVEHIFFLNSPYWTFWAPDVDGLEVRYCSIDVRRTAYDGHGVIDLTAFNTDGFDVTGNNVWIHDCSVWNQDDCFCVKDSSANMVFERINASGFGLTIGSISNSHVRNITFRDARMHKTSKGIYMKFLGDGLIEDITYENIAMEEPEGFGIWIGPAQQSDSIDLCAASPCSLCWPDDKHAQCNAPTNGQYKNIRLVNVTIINPKSSPGVLRANASCPMQNVSFHNVVVQGNANKQPWGDQHYDCENVQGVATGTTNPVPPCFKDDTDATRARQLIATAAGIGAARATLQGAAASVPFAELPDSYPSIPMSAADKSKIKMPLVGLGTWLYNSSVAEAAVVDAFHVGYRHVDTALGYGNHAGISAGLKAVSKALSLTRGDYFVTTKVPGGLNRSATAAALELSLQELQLEQVDLVLLHWPAKGAAARQQQWLALEEFARQGKVRAIGVSHYCRQHLDDVLAVATMPVALNQVQYHVGMGPQSTEYLHDKAYMEQKGVVYMAYSSLCGPCPPPQNLELINGSLVAGIGAHHNKSGPQVALRWVVQQGIPVIPKASKVAYLREDFDIFNFELTEEEMTSLTAATSPPETGTPPQPPDDAQDCAAP